MYYRWSIHSIRYLKLFPSFSSSSSNVPSYVDGREKVHWLNLTVSETHCYLTTRLKLDDEKWSAFTFRLTIARVFRRFFSNQNIYESLEQRNSHFNKSSTNKQTELLINRKYEIAESASRSLLSTKFSRNDILIPDWKAVSVINRNLLARCERKSVPFESKKCSAVKMWFCRDIFA